MLYCVQHRLSDVFDGRCQAHRIQTKQVRVRRADNEKLNSRPNCVNKGVRRSREGALPQVGVPDHCFRRLSLKKGYSEDSMQDDSQTVRQPDTTGRQSRINESNRKHRVPRPRGGKTDLGLATHEVILE